MPSRWGASTVLKGRLLKEQPLSHHTTAASTLAGEQTGACGGGGGAWSVSLCSAHAVRRERERENDREGEKKGREKVAAVSQGGAVTSSPAQVSRTLFAFPLLAAASANAASWALTSAPVGDSVTPPTESLSFCHHCSPHGGNIYLKFDL